MKKKNVLILLSLLHICVFCAGVTVILQNSTRRNASTDLTSDASVPLTGTETETLIEISMAEETLSGEPLAEETDAESHQAEESAIEEILAGPVTEVPPSYTFQYIGHRKNLNIRSAPSLQAGIIGKIPPGQGGTVLERTNEDWALIEYRGTTGYCSMLWIALTPDATD